MQKNYQSEDLGNEGLRIFTTLNTRYQDIVEQSLPKRLVSLEKQKQLSTGTLQAAAVITSIEAGGVLALAEGRNKASNDFNRALDAIRPIGSLVKPAVYLTALMQAGKYNSLTLIEDESVSLKQYDGTVWKPENYDKITRGNVALHTALSKSYNLATVNLGLKPGLNKVVKTLHAPGIEAEIGIPIPVIGITESITITSHANVSNIGQWWFAGSVDTAVTALWRQDGFNVHV